MIKADFINIHHKWRERRWTWRLSNYDDNELTGRMHRYKYFNTKEEAHKDLILTIRKLLEQAKQL